MTTTTQTDTDLQSITLNFGGGSQTFVPQRDEQPQPPTDINAELISTLRELQQAVVDLRVAEISRLERGEASADEAEAVAEAGERVEEAAAAAEADPTPENVERVREEVAGLDALVARVADLEGWRKETVDPTLQAHGAAIAKLNEAVFDENGNPRVATTVVEGEETVADTHRSFDISIFAVVAAGLVFGFLGFLYEWLWKNDVVVGYWLGAGLAVFAAVIAGLISLLIKRRNRS